MVAEQFPTVADAAVAVNITHQETIYAVRPTHAFGKSVVVQIKAHNPAVQGVCLHAVAVQIDDDGGGSISSFRCAGRTAFGLGDFRIGVFFSRIFPQADTEIAVFVVGN